MDSTSFILVGLLLLQSARSELIVPTFCEKCKTDVNDPLCVYCCKVNMCCVAGFAQPNCAGINCGCPNPPDVTTPPPTTTEPTTTTTTPAPRDCKLPPPSSQRIMGGTSVEICERPWMVHFMADIDPDEIPACSGVLISDTKILTSKTCADNFLTNIFWGPKMFARFADKEKYLETQRKVTPDDVKVSGNIAIVTVGKVPVDQEFCIRPVCLPDESTLLTEDENQMCKTASWGLPDPFTKLQEADVSLMSARTCRGVLAILAGFNLFNITLPDDGICTDPTGATSSTCNIDEGGMLLCKDQSNPDAENWVLAGVTHGTPCDPRAPNTFINVTQNMEFIKANM